MAEAGWTTGCASIGRARSEQHVADIAAIGTELNNGVNTDVAPRVCKYKNSIHTL